MPDGFPTVSADDGLTITIPWRDPVAVFAAWAGDPYVAWLDSQGPVGPRSRTSILAIEPFEIFRAGDAGVFDTLAAAMARYRQPDGAGGFTGGAVGFLGYELGGRLERAGRATAAPLPDAVFGLYDVVLGFDRLAQTCTLYSSGLPERTHAARRFRARARAQAVLARLAHPAPAPPAPPILAWRAETSAAVHQARVAQAIAYIAAGDICQANITARFVAPRPPGLSPAGLYLALRARNPAPYGGYLGCGPDLAIASVSPERFVGLTAAGAIEARPIKGTRARGRTPAEDARQAADLLASEKDFSENLMIVDLLRNDIGRVAEIGSVRVHQLAALETFENIHHLVSSVHGMRHPDRSAIDLLRAVFPGGSVTGAPKIRAMQIIGELEPAARGPYCGAIVWLGWNGAMESAIAIRTLTVTPDEIVAQAGGGIVADSDPAAEYEEMLVKIRPLLRALGPWTA